MGDCRITQPTSNGVLQPRQKTHIAIPHEDENRPGVRQRGPAVFDPVYGYEDPMTLDELVDAVNIAVSPEQRAAVEACLTRHDKERVQRKQALRPIMARAVQAAAAAATQKMKTGSSSQGRRVTKAIIKSTIPRRPARHGSNKLVSGRSPEWTLLAASEIYLLSQRTMVGRIMCEIEGILGRHIIEQLQIWVSRKRRGLQQ